MVSTATDGTVFDSRGSYEVRFTFFECLTHAHDGQLPGDPTSIEVNADLCMLYCSHAIQILLDKRYQGVRAKTGFVRVERHVHT
jgi:hypothetical protein